MCPPPDQPAALGLNNGLTLRAAKRSLARQFTAAALPFADEDALDLLLSVTGLSQTDYIMHGTEIIPAAQIGALNTAANRRLSGEPVDRVLGWRDFYGRRFAIDNVLSPRSDTEVLLLAALDAVKDIAAPTLIDLGTGSGALAVSLLCERVDAAALATDYNGDALETARRNAETLGVLDRLSLRQSDWFKSVPPQQVDAIVSNPPYITTQAMGALSREVAAYDPNSALHGGPDGLNPYRRIIPGAQEFLRPGGWLGVEIGYDQGSAAKVLFRESGYENIRLITDPAGLDRVVCGRKSS